MKHTNVRDKRKNEVALVKEFTTPSKIVTGRGALTKAPGYMDGFGQKALIISDQIMVKMGKVRIITDALSKKGIGYTIFHDFLEDPTEAKAKEAYEVYKKEGCDFLIGIGTGAALDLMKAVAVLDGCGGELADHVGEEITGIRTQMAAIPTASGTGAEATAFTYITAADATEPIFLRGQELMPDVAIIDPELTTTLPVKATAVFGLNALILAIEAYISKNSQPITDTLALSAIRRIFRYLPLAYHDGENEVARNQMSIAALEAGVAYNSTGAALISAMSRPVTGIFHVPMGMAEAMLAHLCLEYVKDGAKDRFAEMARATGAATEGDNDDGAAELFLSQIKKICRVCQIPTAAEYGISKDDFFAKIDEMAEIAVKSGGPANTIREPDSEVLKILYMKLYE